MHSIGLALQYFSYAEQSSVADFFPPGFPLQFVSGTPKSTEHGLVFGFNYDGFMRRPGSTLVFRPDLELNIGLHQTYDGSTQAEPVIGSLGDTTGFQFIPVNIHKSNYFVQAGLDIGYCRSRTLLPFYLYTGAKGRLWYRDQVADTTSYSNQVTYSEVYYWFSAPVGLAGSLPITPRVAAGFDLGFDFMFFGGMKAINSAWDAAGTYRTESPPVTLSNKTGFRAEISITDKTVNGHTLRFAPFFDYYAFGKSESETSKQYVNDAYTGPANDVNFNEPSSTTWVAGAKFQIVYMSGKTRNP